MTSTIEETHKAPDAEGSVILRGDLVFTQKPLSAWGYLLFIERSQDPGAATSSPRAVGARLAQAWLFTQCYNLNEEELTEMRLTGLDLSLKEANKLLTALSQITAEVDILDGAETIEESKHLSIRGAEYTMGRVPWEAADKWISDVRVSLAQGYKNMIKSYVKRNGERITDEMLNDPEILGMEEGKTLFELVKYAVN